MKMNGKQPFVITVSREAGAGGHTIARNLAERLGVRFCDKKVMEQVRRQFGLTSYEIESVKAKKKTWLGDLLERIAPVPRSEVILSSLPHNETFVDPDEVVEAERKLLHQLAEEGSCVITGRAAFAILKDHPNALHIFVRSSRENRIKRIVAKQGISTGQAEELIDSLDETRENYVKRVAGTSRYDLRNYDLVINMDGLSEEKAVDLILDYTRE